MGKSKVYNILSSLNKARWQIIGKGILTGLISGLLVSLYRLAIEYGTESAQKIYSYLRERPIMIFPWLAAILLISLFVFWLVRLEPMATGSGIPQVEGILLYGMHMKWYTILFVRFLGGILSSFFGVSLGREGPSIQIGASGSQAVAQKLSNNKLEENYLITGGAAAGLSAAFNAPLSGIVFALEEVHRSFSPLILIAATTASLTADVVSKYFFGLKPVLDFMKIPAFTERFYFWLIPIGLVSGLVGSIMNQTLLKFQSLLERIPSFFRLLLSFIIALPCGLFLPEVLGGGQNLIELSETADRTITMLLIMLIVKLFFTCISFGSGLPGGLFMPILSVGALSGCLLGMISTHCGLPSEYIATFAVCAMAGTLSSSVKAPMTSILLTAEMTGSLARLLPVAACSFIALLVSDLLKVPPIYEALLERIAGENEKSIQNTRKGILLEIPVEPGSEVCNKKIRDIEWPERSLIVGIHRGNQEIVPNGGTKMLSGDYLVILSSESVMKDINEQIGSLCHSKL